MAVLLRRASLSQIPPLPPSLPLSEAICNRESKKDEYKGWRQWLEDKDVPAHVKCDELHKQDGQGWSALHYAAREYCTDILDAALEVAKAWQWQNEHEQWMNYDPSDAEKLEKEQSKPSAGGKVPVTVAGRACTVDVFEMEQIDDATGVARKVRQMKTAVFNVRTSDGLTPLLVAAKYNRKNSVLWLLQDGVGHVENNAVDNQKRNAVHLTVQNMNCEYTLQVLVRQHPELCSEKDVGGNLPLHLAAEVGSVEAFDTDEENEEQMKKLVCQQNDEGMTPLHLAAEHGRVEVVKRINDTCKEALTIVDKEENVPLHFACKYGHAEVTRLIVDVATKCIKKAEEMDKRRVAKAIWQDAELKASIMRHSLEKINTVDKETPLHCAAYNKVDSADLISIVMTGYKECGIHLKNELQRANEHGYTSLMLACKEGKPNVVGAVIKALHLSYGCSTLCGLCKQTVGGEEQGMNCLDLAIHHSHREVVEVIIRSQCYSSKGDVSVGDCWKESLRHTSLEEDGTETTPFRRLIRNMPDAAREVMDKCNSLEFVEDFHYGPVDQDVTDGSSTVGDADRMSWGPKSCRREKHVLTLMVDLKCKDLLKHDLIVKRLNERWNSYGVWLYLVNLIIYCLYLVSLTGFALTLPNPQSDTCTIKKNNETDGTMNFTDTMKENNETDDMCDISSDIRNRLYFAAATSILLSLVRLVMEVIQFIGWYEEKGVLKAEPRWAYFKDWTNWLELPLFPASIVFVVVTSRCVCPPSWQWQLGTVVIFFAWIDLLTFLYKFPKFGVYLLMMEHIVMKFISVIMIALLISLAFGFAFYMTFYDPNVPASPFANPRLAIMKIFSMTAGGPDDTIFRFSNMGSAELDKVEYPELAYFVWIVFIAFMAVLFLNFLIALTVEDVNTLQQSAHFEILRLKVKHVLGSEELFFPFTRKWSCTCKQLPSSIEMLEKVDSMKRTPKLIKGLLSIIIKLSSRALHYFLLWGTEDCDLTIEEKDTNYMVNKLLKRNEKQNTTIADLVRKIDDQERMIKEQRMVMKKFEDVLERYTKEKSA